MFERIKYTFRCFNRLKDFEKSKEHNEERYYDILNYKIKGIDLTIIPTDHAIVSTLIGISIFNTNNSDRFLFIISSFSIIWVSNIFSIINLYKNYKLLKSVDFVEEVEILMLEEL